MRSIVTLAVAAVAAVTLAAQAPMIRPGKYAIAMQMEMPNMPMKMPEIKMEQCVTPDDLKRDPHSWVPSGSQDPKAKDQCKMTDYKVDGQHVTWKVTCTGQQQMTGSGDLTVKGDAYTGVMKMTTPQGEMTMKMAGNRIGDCTK